MGKQHLGPHVVVGYGIKIFWPDLFITSPDHLGVLMQNLSYEKEFHLHENVPVTVGENFMNGFAWKLILTQRQKTIQKITLVSLRWIFSALVPGGLGYSFNGLYWEAPPGTFFRLQVYKRVGISQVAVYKRVGKSVIQVFKRAFNYNILKRCPLWLYQFKTF